MELNDLDGDIIGSVKLNKLLILAEDPQNYENIVFELQELLHHIQEFHANANIEFIMKQITKAEMGPDLEIDGNHLREQIQNIE